MKYLLFTSRHILQLIFFILLFFVILVFPLLFGIVTFVLSNLMFSKLEYDKNLHDRSFYTDKSPNNLYLCYLRFSTKSEVLIKSLLFFILSVLLFSGTDYERLAKLSIYFVIIVGVSALFLTKIENLFKINIERWGYIRFSILFGVIFSIAISAVEGIGMLEISSSLVFGDKSDRSFKEAAELIYGLSYEIIEIIEKILAGIFGSKIAYIISLVLTTNVLYGYIIFLYALQYNRFKRILLNQSDIILSKKNSSLEK